LNLRVENSHYFLLIHMKNAVSSRTYPEPLPARFPSRWLNVYDECDFLSYLAEDVFPKTEEQLSELLLGGIIQRITSLDPDVPEDEVEYDFHSGVREILEKDILVEDLQAVLAAIGDALSGGRAGKFELSALLLAEEGDDTLTASARSFAKFLVPALKRLGLEYLLKNDEDPCGGSWGNQSINCRCSQPQQKRLNFDFLPSSDPSVNIRNHKRSDLAIFL
jgi:hypothetical protein